METVNKNAESGTRTSQSLTKTSGPRRFIRQQVPDSILNDPALKKAMAVLPMNYNFEIPKTVWRVKQAGARKVALQFPEGLLMYSLTICDILEEFAGVKDCFVLGDVTYGACCLDDFSAAALGAEFLVHYGHSCLVPVDFSQIPCLYVFVDIQINLDHLVETVRHNFERGTKLALAGTIQFSTAIHAAKAQLVSDYSHLLIPQAKPLSPGEVLGCTAPALPTGTIDVVVFVADGRFHLEAFMIANPIVKAYRYDPYSRVLTHEQYDQKGMREARRKAIEQAQFTKQWGVILGTLGRQGNPQILKHLEKRLASRGIQFITFLVSELSPSKMALFNKSIEVWVQIACPRLSIDWGEAFQGPLLTPYEAEVALGFVKPWWIAKGWKEGIEPNKVDMRKTQDGSISNGKEFQGSGFSSTSVATDRAVFPSPQSVELEKVEDSVGGRQEDIAGPGKSKESEKNLLDVVQQKLYNGSSLQGADTQDLGFSSSSKGTDSGVSALHPTEVETGKDSLVVTQGGERSLGGAEKLEEVEVGPYPMDYYARDGGLWNSVYQRGPLSSRREGAAKKSSVQVGGNVITIP